MLLNCGVEKTPESPLDCKEIQPVHPKGDQSWVVARELHFVRPKLNRVELRLMQRKACSGCVVLCIS